MINYLVRAQGTDKGGSRAGCHGGSCRGTKASGVQYLWPGEWRNPEGEV